MRNLTGYAVIGVVTVVAFKLLMALFGTVIGLIVTVVFWVFIAFVVYTLLKIFAPGVAGRVRDTVRGRSTSV